MNTELQETNKRLEVIIALLLRLVPKENDGLTMRDQIALLDDLGMQPRDIARIIERTQSYVNKELTVIRKQK